MSVKSFASDELLTLSASESDVERMYPESTSTPEDLNPSETIDEPKPISDVSQCNKPDFNFTWPRHLEDFDSLLPLLRDLPGFTFENSRYHLRGPIPKASQEQLFEKAENVGRLKLYGTQDYFAPSLLLRLALLRPEGSLFPSLSDLIVEDDMSFLESLSLFLSPALRRVTFSGINEAHEASLVTFLQTAAQEVTDLSIVLQHNQLSQVAIEESVHYGSIQSLHLINSVQAFDYHLIEALGHMQSLKELIIHDTEASAEYRSRRVILVDEEKARAEFERLRLFLELARKEDQRILQEVEQEEEARRVEHEEREAEAQRLEEIKCLLRDVSHGLELITRLEEEEVLIQTRYQQPEFQDEQDEDEESWILDESFARLRMWEESVREEDERIQADQRRRSEARQDEDSEPVIRSSAKSETMIAECQTTRPLDISKIPSRRPSLPSSSSIHTSSPEPPDWLSCADQADHPFCSPQIPSANLFPTLTHVSVTGSLVLVQDIVGAISSATLNDVGLRVLASTGEDYNEASKVAELVAFRWFSNLRSFDFDVGPLDDIAITLTFSNSAFRKLLQSPSITQLQLTGWTIEDLEVSLKALSQVKPGPSKIQTLALPSHSDALGISLKQLGYIAKHCPEIASLQCRLKNLLNVPKVSLDYPSLNDQREYLVKLTIGNATPHPDPERLYEVAHFLNALFPTLSTIDVPEGKMQNAEQWELVGKVVKMLKQVREDERQFALQEMFHDY